MDSGFASSSRKVSFHMPCMVSGWSLTSLDSSSLQHGPWHFVLCLLTTNASCTPVEEGGTDWESWFQAPDCHACPLHEGPEQPCPGQSPEIRPRTYQAQSLLPAEFGILAANLRSSAWPGWFSRSGQNRRKEGEVLLLFDPQILPINFKCVYR